MKIRRQVEQDSDTSMPVPNFSAGHLDPFYFSETPNNEDVAQYVRRSDLRYAMQDRSRSSEAGSAPLSILLDVCFLLTIVFMPSMVRLIPFASVTMLTCATIWFTVRAYRFFTASPDTDFLHSDHSPLTPIELDNYETPRGWASVGKLPGMDSRTDLMDPGSTSNLLADIRKTGL
jgi:hypothetical protein